MYLKKSYYRMLESLIKKIIKFKNNSNNNAFQKIIRSAIYYTTKKNRILFSDNKNIKFLMPSCDWISQCLFINESFDYRILEKGIKLLKRKKVGGKNSKSTLINIGAHIGSTCIPAIKKNKFKNLIAFEPTKRTFELLNANIFLNGINDRSQVYNLAISDKKGSLHLNIKNVFDTGSNHIVKNKQKNTETVKSDILDNYTYNLNKNNSLIFMDAESHEYNIFLGAKKTIKKKIPFVFEFAPYLLNKDWLKKISVLFKYYNFFYDIKTSKMKKFDATQMKKLYNHYLPENGFTNILIK